MASPQHRTPEHRAARKRLAAQIKAGQGWCAQPVCVMPSRFIPPATPSRAWHVLHDDSGTVIIGAGHFVCNLHEAGKKRHRVAALVPSRWVL